MSVLTLTIHIGVNVELCDPVQRRGFHPHTLPDTTAGCIENVGRGQRLLANWDDIVIFVRGVMHKDKAGREVLVSCWSTNMMW